nr:MAG: hypothetical protein E4H34_04730 [Hyphomicrobiales bacterium]
MEKRAEPRRANFNAEGDFYGTWLVAHFLIFLALIDAFLFRDLLTPELLASEVAITVQVRVLLFLACAVFAPLILLYALTKRTARGRAGLYQLGAWIFFGLTVYFLVEDYKLYAEPGSFTARINLSIGRIEPLIGMDLPRL